MRSIPPLWQVAIWASFLLAVIALGITLPALSATDIIQTSPQPGDTDGGSQKVQIDLQSDGISSAESSSVTSNAGRDSASATVAANSSLPEGSWERIADLPRKINSLAVDPGNPRVLYAGAGNQGSGSGVYKSEDAGLTWSLASSGLPSEDVTAVAVSPIPPNTIYASAGVRGDIFASNDGGKSWAVLSNSGKFGGLYHQIVVDPSGENLLSAIMPGGVVRSDSRGRSWQAVMDGLPGDVDERIGAYVLTLAIDPADPEVIYAGTGGFVGDGHGVYKSIDGGKTWSPANRGMIDYRIKALAIDPEYNQTIYAGSDTGELFKSTDGGKSWKDVMDRHITKENSQPAITAVSVDPAQPDTVYALMNSVGMLISNDGGMSWSVLGKPGELDNPQFTAMAVTFDPGPVLIAGVDPNIDNAGGWRYAAA